MKEEILKACKDGTLYDFIANNYWNMSKEELKDVCLEAIYLAGNDKEIGENLKEWKWD